jgi:M-phase inducer tyrosine phosphatase
MNPEPGQTLTMVQEHVTTPPLPASSSPAVNELMDISPLPHKQPFLVQIEVQSPSPAQSPADDMMLESPIPRQQSPEASKMGVAEYVFLTYLPTSS